MNDPIKNDEARAGSLIEWTRRNFLKYVGGAAAAGVVPQMLAGCAAPVEGASGFAAQTQSLGVGATGEAINATYVIARASDGFDMQMDLVNLVVTSGQLVPVTASAASYVILRSHPQHVSEATTAVVSIAGNGQIGSEPYSYPTTFFQVPCVSAGPSRLVFCIAPGFAGVPFKLNSILSLLSSCPLNVAANAISDSATGASYGGSAYGAAAHTASSAAPDPTVTSIELPYRLLISPNELSRFVHSNPPAAPASSGRVELSNARLATVGAGNLPDERNATNRTIRALYTRDSTNPSNLMPLGTSDALPHFVRGPIVAQSGTFPAVSNGLTWAPPKSIPVDALMLTPYGGTLQANASWEGASASESLETWKHRASIGRDDYVEATLVGYVLPFGLRAIVTSVSQRQLNAYTEEWASLIQTWQVQLVDTTKDFSAFPGLPLVGHRAMPFQRITALQTTFAIDTPVIANVQVDPNGAPAGALYFAALSNGLPVSIPFTALDRRGRLVKFTMPIFWTDATNYGAGIAQYNQKYAPPTSAGPTSLGSPTLATLNRQRVGLAPSTKDHTTVELDWLAFGVTNVSTTAIPSFCPSVVSMSGVAEAVRALAGNDTPSIMTFDASYAPVVSSANFAQAALAAESVVNGVVQAAVTQTLVNLVGPGAIAAFTSSQASGGLVLPSATFGAIGVVSGLASSAADVFASGAALLSPGATPPNLSWDALLGNAKLFGEIGLGTFAKAAGFNKPPAFVAEAYTVAERYAAELELLADPQKGILPALASVNTAISADIATLQAALADIESVLQNLPAATPITIQGVATDVLNLASAVQAGGTLDTALASIGAPYSGLARAARNQLAKVSSAIQVGGNAIQAALQAMQQGLDVIRDQKAKIEWHAVVPVTASIPSSSLPLITPGTGGSNFCLSVELNGKATDASQALKMFCSLDNFVLNFPPITSPWLRLHFDRIFISQQPGQKTEIDVNLGQLDFLGCLQFIEVIESLIPLDGFSDPPHIDVTAQGIDAGFSFGLPSIAAGCLSFENMKLSADLNVPFVGSALTFTFAFCDSDHPFLVTVSFLGGGGYFTITLASSGDNTAIQELEASISVCAQVAIDLVVASGSLSARAGLTLTYASGQVSLTAFIDLRGAMDILGLISASIEAYLGLTYDFTTNSLTGECKLTIDVEVLGVSKGVVLDFKQTFCGSQGGGPTPDIVHLPIGGPARPIIPLAPAPPMLSPAFADLYTDPNPTAGQPALQTRWTSYCSYFA